MSDGEQQMKLRLLYGHSPPAVQLVVGDACCKIILFIYNRCVCVCVCVCGVFFRTTMSPGCQEMIFKVVVVQKLLLSIIKCVIGSVIHRKIVLK